MTKDILVVPDCHAHPDHHNDRADCLGKFIKDTKPDVVINLGDTYDMPSLYRKTRGKVHKGEYQRDINSGLDFLDRMWYPMRKTKRKMPHRVFLEGNHENRLRKALDKNPQFEGDTHGISYSDYQLDHYHNEVVLYEGDNPGQYSLEGFSFAHYFPSNTGGRAISGDYSANDLIRTNLCSSVCGHSHTADLAIRSSVNGKELIGVVAGVYQDYDAEWAGSVLSRFWWRGLVYLRGVDNGTASVEFIRLNEVQRCYG